MSVESGTAPHVEKLGTIPCDGAPRRLAGSLRLGDILIAEGLATADQVQEALRRQRLSKTYVPLGHVLVRQRITTRRQLASVLERHQRSSKIGDLLVKTGALTAEQLATALAEQRRWKQPFGEVVVRLRFVTEEQLRKALCLQLHINYFDLDTIAPDRSLPVLINPRVVRKLLSLAVDRGASDIHLEAVDRRIQTRFRIDGVLQELDGDGLDELLNVNRGKLMSRLKILSKLDIAERRRPQDGSFRARLKRNGEITPVDFRISIIPSYYGENAVIRILDSRSLPESVEALGLREPIAARMRQLLRSSTGIILVTGPTGSGKSTTLFGALKSVYQPGIKILTAENPIEYVREGFRQHEVDERLGNTFAKYLRSFLRHDPDVIMVGEIRDSETADLAFRAAQTGHLVVRTLHTNEAISALPRLQDLGVDSNLIASSLLGVLAQRLVRAVCAECREPCPPPAELLAELVGVPSADFRW